MQGQEVTANNFRDAFRTTQYIESSALVKQDLIWAQVEATAGTHGSYPAIETLF